MLDSNLKSQLKSYLERVTLPFEIVASVDATEASQEMLGLLNDVVELCDKITLKTDGNDARRPSFTLSRIGEAPRIRFAATPMGHEFTSLVLALLQVGGHPPKLEAELAQQVRNLDGDYRFEVFMSLGCHNCPDVVQALNLMAVLNPRIQSTIIDGALYQDEVAQREILAVPMIFLNGEHFGQGRMGVEEIMAKIDTGSEYVFPVIAVSSDSYQHNSYGRTYVPVLDIVGWADMQGREEDGDAPVAVDTKVKADTAPARKAAAVLGCCAACAP